MIMDGKIIIEWRYLVITNADREWNETDTVYTRGGQLDKLREPHFRRQLRQEPRLYWSSQTYGSNTDHCLRERS
jgi:hypothetical protein